MHLFAFWLVNIYLLGQFTIRFFAVRRKLNSLKAASNINVCISKIKVSYTLQNNAILHCNIITLKK